MINDVKNFSPLFVVLIMVSVWSCSSHDPQQEKLPLLKVSENKRFLADENNQPFFWLGDTGWLLFKKLSREEADRYLENRKQKGFNLIQVMVLHDLADNTNFYGDAPFVGDDVSEPLVTPGNSPDDSTEYDFWDHVDYIIQLAEEKGLYMALVPVWGSNVKSGRITEEQIISYGTWLANRYRSFNNIVWLNGGDIFGTDSIEIWKALGNTLNLHDTSHLITFHPRGRTQSSMWFHNEKWLDFNMIQSGHRRYDQDDTELSYGEDNWRYIRSDYQLSRSKPTIDGEPSYEGIPQGLHDTEQPKWTDADARRYAYWAVFAGAFGHTYGHNSVMQFYKPGDDPAYGATLFWEEALEAPGAKQMRYLKELIVSRPFFDRIPDQNLIAENTGGKYDYMLATRGTDYTFIYTYSGQLMKINMGKIEGERVKASWFNPRTGELSEIGLFENLGTAEFDPPGSQKDGNDWVLVLDSYAP